MTCVSQPNHGAGHLKTAPSAKLTNMCLLCRRRLPSAAALAKHELFSPLHRQNLERQDEIVRAHRQEIWLNAGVVRQQLAEASSDPVRRPLLETKLRQLLGEYGMAQEMLEYSWATQKDAEAASKGLPLHPATFHEARIGNVVLDIGAASWQGLKNFQEDKFIVDLNLQTPKGQPVIGFCVMDGHSGSRCVDFLVERLQQELQATLSTKPALTEIYLRRAVVEAAAKVDAAFLHFARQSDLMDGSTMVLGLMFCDAGHPGSCRMLVANVGDSRAVLCRAVSEAASGQEQLGAMRITEDHKPNRPDELKRIESRGGIVDHHGVWRVFCPTQVAFGGRTIPRWGLAVSRAFGDLLLKEPECYGCNSVSPGGLVISEPELHCIEINLDSDRFIVLACDGVWDVLRDEDAVAACASQAGAELAANTLVRHAFAAGSGDNLTAVVIALRPAD